MSWIGKARSPRTAKSELESPAAIQVIGAIFKTSRACLTSTPAVSFAQITVIPAMAWRTGKGDQKHAFKLVYERAETARKRP